MLTAALLNEYWPRQPFSLYTAFHQCSFTYFPPSPQKCCFSFSYILFGRRLHDGKEADRGYSQKVGLEKA